MPIVQMHCLHLRESVRTSLADETVVLGPLLTLIKAFFNIDMGWGFQLLFTLSSQLIGISLAGLFRRFLVWYDHSLVTIFAIHYSQAIYRPAAMIWPITFANTALFHALHDKSKSDASQTNGWQISRYRWFVYLTMASFAYYWYGSSHLSV